MLGNTIKRNVVKMKMSLMKIDEEEPGELS